MKMQNPTDPDQPSVWFWTDHRGRAGLHVASRMRLYYLPAGTLARLVVLWCRLFHRGQRSFDSPAAGRYLWWPIRCHRCGCRYDIQTPNERGWENPFQSKLNLMRNNAAEAARLFQAWAMTMKNGFTRYSV